MAFQAELSDISVDSSLLVDSFLVAASESSSCSEAASPEEMGESYLGASKGIQWVDSASPDELDLAEGPCLEERVSLGD